MICFVCCFLKRLFFICSDWFVRAFLSISFLYLHLHFYVGYLFFLLFRVFLLQKDGRVGSGKYLFRCGNCGEKIKEKGQCPYCGAINK